MLRIAIIIADVAKLADALDLGSSAARHRGSSPFIRTLTCRKFLSCFLIPATLKSTFDTKSPTEGILTLQLDPADYQPSWEKALTQQNKKVKLKGFRQGHAPNEKIKEYYGNQLLYQTIQQVAQQELFDCLKSYQIAMLGMPVLTDHDLDKLVWQTPTTHTLHYRVGLTPDIELPHPDQLNVTSYHIDTVSEKDLTYIINELQKVHTSYEAVPSAEKDHILQGELSSTTGETTLFHIPLVEATQAIHPHFLGKKPGDTLTLTKEIMQGLEPLGPLPDNVQKILDNDPQPTYDFLVKTVYQRKLPELTSDFFTKVIGKPVDTEEAFKQALIEHVITKDRVQAEKLLQHTIREELLTHTHLPLPDELLKIWLHNKGGEKVSPETIEKDYPAYAQSVKWDLIVDKIMQEYQLEVSAEAVQQKITQQLTAANPDSIPQETMQAQITAVMENKTGRTYRYIKEMAKEEHALAHLLTLIQPTEQTLNSSQFHAILKEKNNTLTNR